jgi:hypothetical protein
MCRRPAAGLAVGRSGSSPSRINIWGFHRQFVVDGRIGRLDHLRIGFAFGGDNRHPRNAGGFGHDRLIMTLKIAHKIRRLLQSVSHKRQRRRFDPDVREWRRLVKGRSCDREHDAIRENVNLHGICAGGWKMGHANCTSDPRTPGLILGSAHCTALCKCLQAYRSPLLRCTPSPWCEASRPRHGGNVA